VNVTQEQRGVDRVRVELLARCLAERVEPPTAGRIDRIVRSALHRGEEVLVTRVIARLPEVVHARLLALVAAAADDDTEHDDGDGPAVLSSIRSEPGNVSLNTMLTEIAKLEVVRAVGLPADGVRRRRAQGGHGLAGTGGGGVPEPSTWPFAGGDGDAAGSAVALPRAGDYRHACGAADPTVHRINARAEVRVTKELVKEFKRVTGKENLLFRVAETTVNAGDQLVRDTVFPVASQAVLADLVAEFKSSGPTYQRTVKTTVKGSYTNHYRTVDRRSFCGRSRHRECRSGIRFGWHSDVLVGMVTQRPGRVVVGHRHGDGRIWV